MYAELNKNVLRCRLNVVVDERMSFSSVGSRFHARGAATENARSLNHHYVRGRKRLPLLLEARNEEHDGMPATCVNRSKTTCVNKSKMRM